MVVEVGGEMFAGSQSEPDNLTAFPAEIGKSRE